MILLNIFTNKGFPIVVSVPLLQKNYTNIVGTLILVVIALIVLVLVAAKTGVEEITTVAKLCFYL